MEASVASGPEPIKTVEFPSTDSKSATALVDPSPVPTTGLPAFGSSRKARNPTAKGLDRFPSSLTHRTFDRYIAFSSEYSFGIAVAVYEVVHSSNSLNAVLG